MKVYGANASIEFAPGKAHRDTLLLTDYLTFHQVSNDVNLINSLKCQVLNLYWQITKSDHPLTVEIDPNTWLFSRTSRHIIFPYKPLQTAWPTVSQQSDLLLKNWSSLQGRYAITSAKPNKRLFDNELQASLTETVQTYLLEQVASIPAVARIHLMGSASRGEMGLYCAPYAYGKQAKVGSDIDILIEIEPDQEQDIPLEWKLVSRRAQNSSCAVYHVGEIPSPWPVVHFEEDYPDIPLTHHVIDAHVYLPSASDAGIKQRFLTDHKALLLYDKSRDGQFQSETAQHLINDLKLVVDITPEHLSKMPVHTQNRLYTFSADQQHYVLKLHQVAGNLGWDRIAEHTLYEYDLLTALKSRGFSVPAILSTRGAIVDGLPAIVCEKIGGSIFAQPPFPLPDIAKTLAALHQMQLENPLVISSAFLFEQVWKIWTKSFYKYLKHSKLSATLTKQHEKLSVFADRLIANKPGNGLFVTSPNLHLHGDVTPRNFIQGDNIVIFDFNNAYFGPRIIDVVDGAFELSLSSPQPRIDDFDSFIKNYQEFSALESAEQSFLTDWILAVGIIKFAKEIKMIAENNNISSRESRALHIADCIFGKVRLS
jgi:Ser/Thr protein kinase RdoA (MazF antagonist)/predicted nucleotidyltransferase